LEAYRLSIDPDAVPKYLSQPASKAAGISISTLSNWVFRSPPAVPLGRDAEGQKRGKGNALLFSFNRVLQIALTAELVDYGFSPRQAAGMVFPFTDGTSAYEPGASGWSEEPYEEVAKRLRMPGKLFPVGQTVLVISKESAVGTVVNVRDDTVFKDVLPPDGKGVLLIPIDPIYWRVRDALDAYEKSLAETKQRTPQGAF
jgi:hypothetical protein